MDTIRRVALTALMVLLVSLVFAVAPGNAYSLESKNDMLHPQITKVTKSKVGLVWGKGGKRPVVIYRSVGGKKYKKYAKAKGSYFTDKKVKKGTTYFYKVVLSKSDVARSLSVSARPGSGNRMVGSVTVSSRVSIPLGANYQLKVKVAAVKGKRPLSKKLQYVSSNEKVAKVTKAGLVETVGQGTCYVECVAHSGRSSRVRVDVTEPGVPVFAYHNIVSDEEKRTIKKYRDSDIVMSISEFDTQMKWLSQNHYKTLSCTDFERWYKGGLKIPYKTVMLTFDDGFLGTLKNATPVLKKYKLKGTYFIVGDAATREEKGEKRVYGSLDDIRAAVNSYGGIECQSHSWGFHTGSNPVSLRTYRDCVEDCDKQFSQFGYTFLAYPYGSDPVFYRNAVRDAGYMKMAFDYGNNAMAFRTSDRWSVPRVKVSAGASIDRFEKWAKKEYS